MRLGTALDALGPGSRDAPERHQTLRATMDWSFRLLDEPERQAFSALAAFRGGCTLEAAEAVAPAALTILAVPSGQEPARAQRGPPDDARDGARVRARTPGPAR